MLKRLKGLVRKENKMDTRRDSESSGSSFELVGPKRLSRSLSQFQSKPVRMLQYEGEDWTPVDYSEMSSTAATVANPHNLNLATLNIWFDSKKQSERFQAMILELLPDDKDPKDWPAIITLQEVCKTTVGYIRANAKIREYYYITDPAVVTRESWYGMITFVSKATFPNARIHARYYSFGAQLITDSGDRLPGNSKLGRGLLSVALSESIVIGNVHLESPVAGVKAETRKSQVGLATSALQAELVQAGCKMWFLMGDFNFTAKAENAVIDSSGATDLWTLLNPNVEGLTFDYKQNPNIDGSYQGRPDRIIVQKSGKAELVEGESSIILLGTTVDDSCGVPPSDHFGLRASICLGY